jgi:diguanylate cyclase (GGDEF)-like protein
MQERPEPDDRSGRRHQSTMIQSVAIELSDWLAAEIAVVAASGAIVRNNRTWDETAKVGGLAAKASGWNYFAECEAAIERGCPEVPAILSGIRAVLNGERPTFIATYACPFNDLYHWFEVVVSALEFDGKRYAIVMHVDVSALQVDALTGLPNRAMFDAQLDLAVSTARERHCRTGMLIVDLNNLKSLNDVHGHQTGDAAIKAVANELKKQAGADCVVARIGGDEFGVVLPVSFDTLSARRLRAHFKGGIAASVGSDGRTISIAASVGLALYPEDGATKKALFISADRSMYEQKRGLSVA